MMDPPQRTPPRSPWRLRLYLCLVLLTVFILVQVVHEHLTVASKALVVLTTHSFLCPLNQ